MKTALIDFIKLILRCSIGVILLMRLLYQGSLIPSFYQAIGFRGMLSIEGGIFIAQIAVLAFVCIMLVLGFKTKIASGGLFIFALLLALNNFHYESLFLRNDNNVWVFEAPLLFSIAAINIYFLGAGRFSIDFLRSQKIRPLD